MIDFLLRTSSDRNHGCGHIKRQFVLADELLSRGYSLGFEIPESTIGYDLAAQWIVDRKSNRLSLNDFSANYKTIVIDLEGGPSRKLLSDARQKFAHVIVVGGVGFPILDQESIDELVDLQIYQSVAINSEVPATNVVVGCEYLILSPDYLAARAIYDHTFSNSEILVTMGGADPHEITPLVCDKLTRATEIHYPVHAVYGPAAHVRPAKALKTTIAPPSLLRALTSARLAVTALGMTTYEAACVGVPTASICWSEDHSVTADILESQGVTVNLGLWESPDWNKLGTWMDRMGNIGAWRQQSEAGKALVDGRGVSRVADRIEAML